ncbi:DUF6683 family protein [Altererythrobacter sp. CAU 1778]
MSPDTPAYCLESEMNGKAIKLLWLIGLSIASSPASAQANFYFSPPVPVHMPVTQWQVQSDDEEGDTAEEFRPDLQVRELDLLRFKPMQSRRSSNLEKFAEAAATDRDRAQLTELFASQPNLIDDIGSVMQSYGLDPSNVADAYALWWMSAWLVANQRQDTPPSATISAVRDQARNAFAATPGFAEVDDAGKQQYAEALMVQATLLNTALEQSANQPEMLAQLAQAAKQGALSSGLDLNTMVLSEQGFVPRDGSDASGVVREDAQALAQVDDGSNATLVAIAAALGLGLGGAFWLGKKAG